MSAAQIRAAREAAGLSLYEVPRRMPVSIVRWARIEAGVDAPTDAEIADFERHVLRRRRGAAARLVGGLPELPDPVHEDVGSALLPLPVRGRHVLPWSVVLDSVRLAMAGGTAGQPLDGFDGQYLALILEGAEGCDYDDEFKAAIESGDAVWDGKYLHVRVGGRPVETLN